MANQKILTRICVACGIEKPLSAFLQITGSQGTTYGIICSTCRSAGIKGKAPAPTHEDERSSTSSGMRIGAKERLEIDQQKKRDRQESQSREEQEAKKREKTKEDKFERIVETEKAEKTHRETFIEEKKKQAFLNYQSKKPLSGQSIIGQKKDERASAQEEKHRSVEASRKEEAIQHEQKITTLDLSGGPVLDQPFTAMTNRESVHFKQFQAWLGDAPVAKTMSQLYRNNMTNQAKAAQEKKATEIKNLEKETPREFVEKTWGPSSRKS